MLGLHQGGSGCGPSSSVMPVYVNLILLVIVMPVSVLLYIVGELVYAKDRARIFPCCREVTTEEEKEEKSFETQSLGPNREGCYINTNGVYFEKHPFNLNQFDML